MFQDANAGSFITSVRFVVNLGSWKVAANVTDSYDVRVTFGVSRIEVLVIVS